MRVLSIILAYSVGPVIGWAHSFYSSISVGNNTETLQHRWTITGPPSVPWPQDSDSSFHTIRYCFCDAISSNDLKGLIPKAIALWFSQLGPAGQQNGHALRMIEAQSPQPEQPYCYAINTGDDDTPKWNTLFEDSTLVIQRNPSGESGGEATTGYTPNGRPGQHYLMLGKGALTDDEMTPTAAHELGHVFGLVHEHQRLDRDNYLNYDCRNIIGYEDALNAVQGSRYTVENLCENQMRARQFDFHFATEFTKMEWDDYGNIINMRQGPFDIHSIMMYDSEAFIDEETKDINNIMDMPLVQWRIPNQDHPPTRRTSGNSLPIPSPVQVSQLDCDGIKHIYPWN